MDTGIVKVNVEPRPTSLFTQIRPPIIALLRFNDP
jgi:hypothetical protein